MDRKPLSDNSESFIERWSRRKRLAEEEAGSLPEVGGPEPAGLPDAVGAEPPLTDADMPPIEKLGEDDDYSGFFSDGVSEALRRAALRRLFRSAKFNTTDGLDDYAEDFTKFAPLGDIVTADMKHRLQQLVNKVAGEEEVGESGGHPATAASDDPAGEDTPAEAPEEEKAEIEASGKEEDSGR